MNVSEFASTESGDALFLRVGSKVIKMPLTSEGEAVPDQLEAVGVEGHEAVIFTMAALERVLLAMLPPQIREAAIAAAHEKAATLARAIQQGGG